MRKYIFIGCGSFLGAVLRYVVRGMELQSFLGRIPTGTLVINLSGAFLLAFLLTAALEVWTVDSDLRLGLTTGFLGAYTTFSTLCKESAGLINSGDYGSAAAYLTLSAVLGLGFAYLGCLAARKLALSLSGKREKRKIQIEKKAIEE
ncbi:putative fluoride ion transporter CrcB [bioreactor metagenome]|uniref:Putative fluoride ion transporter CrcB n=1 Tax=bioreactor metagenome TaxID=1076179 RepID=A0A644YPW6_9ZZZZ